MHEGESGGKMEGERGEGDVKRRLESRGWWWCFKVQSKRDRENRNNAILSFFFPMVVRLCLRVGYHVSMRTLTPTWLRAPQVPNLDFSE